MSKSTGLYNPVPDGLSAQIWECMRRNTQFEAALAALTHGTVAIRAAAHSELYKNVFSRAASDAATQGLVGRDLIALAWPTLPDDLRVKFDSLVADLRETPTPIHAPHVSESCGPFSANDRLVLTNFLRLWEKYEIVGLPRIMLDEPHRRKSKTTVGSHVPRVVRFPLGAKRQWATYLLKEKHERTPLRDDARALAAWEHLEVESYKRFRGSKLSAKGIAEARRALSRQGNEFYKRITAVEAAIKAVYPRFVVFGGQRQ